MTHRLVLENLKHRPLRTGLSVFLIGIPVTLILTLVGLSVGMREDSARRSRGVGADIIVRPPGTSALNLSGAPLPEGIVKRLAGEPHVRMAAGVVVYLIPPFNSVNGVVWEQMEQLSGGFRFLEGRPFREPDEAVVDAFYAQQNNLHAGSTFKLMNRTWKVAGIVEPGKLARILVRMDVLQDLIASTGKISQVYLKLDDAKHTEATIKHLKSLPGLEEYPIYSIEELSSLISASSIPELNVFINVVVGIAVVIGFAVVFLSMYTAVLQRTREIGILKSLGASRSYVLQLILFEALFLGLAGSVLGIVLTYGAKALISVLVPATLRQAIVPSWWPIASGIALAAATLGAAYPGARAARQDPIEALAYE